MSKERLFYDILTIIYILLVVGGFIYLSFGFFEGTEGGGSIETFATKLAIINFIILIPTLIYAIAIITLAFRRANKTSDKVVVLIGSIILPGILPLIYYFTNLRKQIPSEQSTQLALQKPVKKLKWWLWLIIILLVLGLLILIIF